MRASSACFLLSQSAPTAIRPYNGAENAARCIGHRTALHTASQRAAQAIAPHCTTEGRTGGRNREGCGEDGRTRCRPLRSWMRKQAERALPTAEKEQKKERTTPIHSPHAAHMPAQWQSGAQISRKNFALQRNFLIFAEYITEKRTQAMKGIVLAGGSGTRLYPITKGISKQLMPIYDKPMIYYPVSVLMQAGIREILIISTPFDLPGFQRLLGDGSDIGVSFTYAEQPSPDGLAQAFTIGADFIGDDCVCLVLGDNIFQGNGFHSMLTEAVRAAEEESKATVFGYWVKDPERYGVAEFDSNNNCISIEEKPQHPRSNYAVVGLYFYPNKVVSVARSIEPSARGEYEITTVNQRFLEDGELKVQTLGHGFAWLDTGTHDSLSEASTYIEVLEKRQGIKIGCLEGIAYRSGWIDEEQMRKLAQPMLKNQYGQYLLQVIEEVKRYGRNSQDF